MSIEDHVRDALRAVMDPELGRSLVDLGMVRHIGVRDGVVNLVIALTTMSCPLRGSIAEDARSAVMRLPGVREVDVRRQRSCATLGASRTTERHRSNSWVRPSWPRCRPVLGLRSFGNRRQTV